MTLNIFDTREEAIGVLAKYFVQIANEAIEDRDRFSVALSGGNTPRELYALLATDAYREKVADWSKIFFFFGDERYVPPTDKDSNYHMAKEVLFDPLNIPSSQIFRVNTSLPPQQAAADYQDQLDNFHLVREIQFDLILLGLGDNVHTASLFPHTEVLRDSDPAVKAVHLPESSSWRITLNAPMINNARHIAFLVFGGEKARAMQHVFSDTVNIDLYPAQLIRKKRIAWFTDAAAAALL
jgi:6-phosphogluconolactonase